MENGSESGGVWNMALKVEDVWNMALSSRGVWYMALVVEGCGIWLW